MIPLKHRMLRKRGRYMRVLTAAEIRGLESCAVESGVSMETLMENAGAEVAAAVTEKMDVTGKKTVILCGKGNNGGDGFVAARLLAAEGAKVTVVLMQGAPASDLAKQAYDKMGRGIEIIMYRTAGGAVDAADVQRKIKKRFTFPWIFQAVRCVIPARWRARALRQTLR